MKKENNNDKSRNPPPFLVANLRTLIIKELKFSTIKQGKGGNNNIKYNQTLNILFSVAVNTNQRNTIIILFINCWLLPVNTSPRFKK